MRLVSYGAKGAERLGVLVRDGSRIVDLNKADGALPATMLEYLNGDFSARAKALASDAAVQNGPASLPTASVRLGAPVPKPGQIICVGLNYKDHADEQNLPYPASPLLFGKSPLAACGPQDTIEYPEPVTQLDYEVELGVVIGKRAKKVAAADALNYVAGYCVFHDVSARCCQYGDKQWFRGKSFDTFAPFGPALVTPDDVGDPHALAVKCTVNGEVRQNSTTANLIHRIDQVIAYITRGITLLPGDVIATGTPGGVGAFFKPPKFLNRGDVVELSIDKLGSLTNRVV